MRAVASLLNDWDAPHGEDGLVIRGVDFKEGELRIAVVPGRPQCPCCLKDLTDLRTGLLKRKGVESVFLQVMEVPAAERWTRVVNQ